MAKPIQLEAEKHVSFTKLEQDKFHTCLMKVQNCPMPIQGLKLKSMSALPSWNKINFTRVL
jgi:hypothetical protein